VFCAVCRFNVLMFYVQSSIELLYAINHSFIHSFTFYEESHSFTCHQTRATPFIAQLQKHHRPLARTHCTEAYETTKRLQLCLDSLARFVEEEKVRKWGKEMEMEKTRKGEGRYGTHFLAQSEANARRDSQAELT